MGSLIESCESFSQYPQNVIQSDVLSYALKSYSKRLDIEEKRLFNERQAAVNFLDLRSLDQGFLPSCATTLSELKEILREGWSVGRDPQCRFIFMHSPHSRAPLRISRPMLSFLLTYHQVMPSFLDFVFPFGAQIEAQDFYFSGLRDETRLGIRHRGVEIPELNRSGNELRLCYNLRSVEPSNSQPPALQWSIRQSAVYHSFDVETGQSLWINVKGNKLIENRITEATGPSSRISNPTTPEAAFSATLSIHLLLCDWSCENWRWYLNDLETEFQRLAREAPYIPIDREHSPPASPRLFAISPRLNTGGFSPVSRSGTFPSLRSIRTKTESFSPVSPSRATTLTYPLATVTAADPSQDNCYDHKTEKKSGFMDIGRLKKSLRSSYLDLKSNWSRHSSHEDTVTQPSKPLDNGLPASSRTLNEKQMPEETPPNFSKDGDERPQEVFTFTDLQALQGIEDKTQETLLVLRLNAEVLEELRKHYHFATAHPDFPAKFKLQCEMDLAKFDKTVVNFEKDLRMLRSRADTLLRMIANKKSLLNGILQYRGVKANESFARKNQISAERMEQMTVEMHAIAKKTEQETVSMRVITTVTLFFLPATFIATFMSTDILKFQNGERDFELQALHIYLAIALPLTALTFVAWWIFYSVAKKRPSTELV